MASGAEKKEVCVTGANGYVAGHVVKHLLEKGYKVRGTVRNPLDSKNGYLMDLPHARENLTLVHADLDEPGSFDAALAGCDGLFHVASPLSMTGTREEMVDTPVKGTKDVLAAVLKSGTIKTVVVTSSMAAVSFNGNTLPPDHVYTEEDWSREDILDERKIYYPLGKTLAEKAAYEHQQNSNGAYRLVTLNPVVIIGPLLHAKSGGSAGMLLSYLDGSKKEIPRSTNGFVDVRDLAEMHVNAYERGDVNGRHIIMLLSNPWEDTCEVLRRIAPKYTDKIPTALAAGTKPTPMQFNNQKSIALLGHPYRDFEETLRDSIASFEHCGFL